MKVTIPMRWHFLLSLLTFLAAICCSVAQDDFLFDDTPFSDDGYYHSNEPEIPLSPSPLPAICQRDVLKPAVECGCWAYSNFYTIFDVWQGLNDLCVEILGGPVLLGRSSCPNTPFATGSGDIYGDIDRRATDEFFSITSQVCVLDRWSDWNPTAGYQQETQVRRVGMIRDMVKSVRISFDYVNKKLLRFCLVASNFAGKSRREAWNICCHPRRRCY